MKRTLIPLAITLILLLPSISKCDTVTDNLTYKTIEKLKELKIENIHLSSMTTEDGKIIVQGYATNNEIVSKYLEFLDKIGTTRLQEIHPSEFDGKLVSQFTVSIEPAPIVDFPQWVTEGPPPFVILADHSNDQLAWWYGAKFHPFGKSIRGIPVKTINENWCVANEFKKELFPKSVFEGAIGLNEILKEGSFSVTGKFDGVRTISALVGVYESCDKTIGAFLLFLNTKNRNKPVIYIQEYGESFAFLEHFDKSGVVVWNCFACDGATIFSWDKSTHQFVSKFTGYGGE
jgi:hypothetical protein